MGGRPGFADHVQRAVALDSHDSVTRKSFNRFLEQFESHEMLLVGWPGCTVDDRRLEEVGNALLAVREQRAGLGQPELISEVLSGYTMLRMLRRQPARLSRTTAIRRMRGSLVGADGRTSCVVVTLTERGALLRRESFNLTLDTIQRVTGLERKDLRVAGPTVDGMARMMKAYVRSCGIRCPPS